MELNYSIEMGLFCIVLWLTLGYMYVCIYLVLVDAYYNIEYSHQGHYILDFHDIIKGGLWNLTYEFNLIYECTLILNYVQFSRFY